MKKLIVLALCAVLTLSMMMMPLSVASAFTFPKITVPKIFRPNISPPNISLPDIVPPNISLPNITLPDISLPNIVLPNISLPDISPPKVSLPNIALPDIILPGIPNVTGLVKAEAANGLSATDASLSDCSGAGLYYVPLSTDIVFVINGRTNADVQMQSSPENLLSYLCTLTSDEDQTAQLEIRVLKEENKLNSSIGETELTKGENSFGALIKLPEKLEGQYRVELWIGETLINTAEWPINTGETVSEMASILDNDIVFEMPPNGECAYYTAKNTESPFKITTPVGEDYYYIILTELNKDLKIITFIAHPGKTVTVQVPLGEFRMFYATGTQWFGEDELFGDKTEYYEADGFMQFYVEGDYIKYQTVELIKQEKGNLETYPIDEFSFPKLGHNSN